MVNTLRITHLQKIGTNLAKLQISVFQPNRHSSHVANGLLNEEYGFVLKKIQTEIFEIKISLKKESLFLPI